MRHDPLPFSVPAQRPTQAVILAGGRGTRLGPYTDDRPKPMVPVLGSPFLNTRSNSFGRRGSKGFCLSARVFAPCGDGPLR